MFLVIYRTRLDDLPAGLFATREEAEAFAATMPPAPPEHLLDVMRVDRTDVCAIAIVEFVGSQPVRLDFARVYGDERESLGTLPCVHQRPENVEV